MKLVNHPLMNSRRLIYRNVPSANTGLIADQYNHKSRIL
jgi:hypothetical protein